MVEFGIALQFGLLVGSVVGLWVGARLLVDTVVRLARRLGLAERTIGLTVVAMGTSTPELVVTTDAALAGLGDIAVGNVVGSNVYNLAFILGVVSLVRVVPIERSLLHRDGAALVASTFLGAVVLFDLTVTRLEGVVLVGSLVAYTGYLLRTSGDEAADATGDTADPSGPTIDVTEPATFGWRDGLLLVGGLVVVLVGGHLMVESATALARGAGIAEWVIGGTIVAAGTSTPEFAVSLVAMRRGSVGVSIGNVVGSNVFNVLGIVGVGALVRPLVVAAAALESVAWLSAIVVVVVVALWSGRKLSRAEGGLLALSEIGRWVLGLLGILG
jgi:cation:H+ antiporter